MAENLWQLRRKKGLTVKQLAAKVGIPAETLFAYEQGEALTATHRARLARVLFVEATDIKVKSDPKPEKKREGTAVSPPPYPKPEKPKPQPKPPVERPIRPSQIEHLLQLATNMREDATTLAAKIGQPLDTLTQSQASQWLRHYTQALATYKTEQRGLRPPDTRRKRAHLPESVDEFEMAYLTELQTAGKMVVWKLLNGEVLYGRIIGFSPYNITIRQPDNSETTIQKLALAYYHHQPQVELSNL